MRAVVRHLLGWGSLLLGIAGLFLPGLQGLLLIATGAILLAPDVPVFARLLAWIEDRHPAIRSGLRRLRGRFGHHRDGQG